MNICVQGKCVYFLSLLSSPRIRKELNAMEHHWSIHQNTCDHQLSLDNKSG